MCGEGRHMPLAVDLFCGLGGWTDGLLVEGYIWYDWICHTKLVRSPIGSGKRSERPAGAGFGPQQLFHSATAFSSSRKASHRKALIGFHGNCLSALFQRGCKSFIDAITRLVSGRIISSWGRKKTTSETATQRSVGDIVQEIRMARIIRMPFLAMLKWRACSRKLLLAGDL